MESSKFIQFSDEILIEYIYTDQAQPSVFNTASYPIEILKNNYTGGSYLFNTDSVSATMGNYRDISAIPINSDKNKYVYLDTSLGVPYNDFDTNLTPSADLLQEFVPELDIEYDRIKIHFTAGFTFQDFDGIIFEVSTIKRDSTDVVFSSINLLKNDTVQLNPDPLLIADKLYSSYIEWKIPSLYFIKNNYTSSNTNSLGYRLTDGKGFMSSPIITINALGILESKITNGYTFYNVTKINSASIPLRDIYDNLFAQVIESPSGDFFELTGLVTGSTFSNFISRLNAEGNNYVVFHEITISEQIGVDFIQTSNQLISQTDNFDNPVFIRPIILNSAYAVSFAINYTLRLYNRIDNTQIIKNARLVSFDVKKYGRRLMKINLGTVPTVANVVNQISPDDGRNIIVSNGGYQRNDNLPNAQETPIVIKTKYITSFRDRLNIKAAISPARIQNIVEKQPQSRNVIPANARASSSIGIDRTENIINNNGNQLGDSTI